MISITMEIMSSGAELSAKRFNNELLDIAVDSDHSEALFDNASSYPDEDHDQPVREELRSEDEALSRLISNKRKVDNEVWAKIQEQEEEGTWERRWLETQGTSFPFKQDKTLRILKEAFVSVANRLQQLHAELKSINEQGGAMDEKRRSRASEGDKRKPRTAKMDASSILNEMMDLQGLLDAACDEVMGSASKLRAKGDMLHEEFEYERGREGRERTRPIATHSEEHWV